MSCRSCMIFLAILAGSTGGAPAQTAPLKLKPLAVRDPMVNNIEAFSLLVPENWRAEGGIVWNDQLATLAYTQMRIADPASARALEVFPNIPYTWNERGYIGFPPGSLYLGMYVVRPLDPEQFMRTILLPGVRGRVNPKVIGTQELPALAKQVAATVQEPGAVKRVAATRTRIEYQDGARAIEEDIYCIIVYTQVPAVPGLTMWGPERVFGFRAEKGQLDRQAPLLQAMSASVRVNRSWFAHYLQVQEAWVQNRMNAIRRAGELSRYLARTSDEMSDMQMQAWENRQASQDRSAQAFSEYIRGVETYHDPYGDRDVQLPSGYNDVWVSRGGEYILANDPNFNPNVSATGTWQRVDPTAH